MNSKERNEDNINEQSENKETVCRLPFAQLFPAPVCPKTYDEMNFSHHVFSSSKFIKKSRQVHQFIKSADEPGVHHEKSDEYWRKSYE